MFGGVYGKLSEERTWQQPCRNLVLFYPNVGPGKGFNEVSWPGPISFPLISHDFQYPLSPFFAPQDSVVLVGACDSEMGALFLVSALSPYNNCQWLTLLCAVHSPSWDTLSLGCCAQPLLGHPVLRLSGDHYAGGGQNQDTQLPMWGCHLCRFGSAPFI